jgi:DNA end-binding protein Ku
MAPRAHWKGYLKLSLVSCPISLYPAVSAAEKISFRQINRDTGHRLRQQLVDSVTGEVVESHNKGRGYEVGEDQVLIVQDEELETAKQEARTRPFTPILRDKSSEQDEPARGEQEPARRGGPGLKVVQSRQVAEEPPPPMPPAPPRPLLENTRTIELDRFIPRSQIDPRYYNTPYDLAPRDEVGLEAFAVIRDAMARLGLVGMGRVVLSNRERPLFIEPMGLGLRGVTLRYAHEIRSEQEYFEDIPRIELPDDVVEVTEHILRMKQEDFDPTYLEDRYRTVLVEKLREKRATTPVVSVSPPPSRANVINLMDALKRSLAAQKPPAGSISKKAKRAAAGAKLPPKRSSAKTTRRSP